MLQALKDISTIAAACITAISVIIALTAYRTTRENQKEALVQKAYYDYAKMALDRPDLAFPPRSAFDFEKQELNGSELEFERYEWFLSAMLVTVHFLMRMYPADEFWRTLTTNQISYHWQYLEKFWTTKSFIVNWRTVLETQMLDGINRGKQKFQPKMRGSIGPACCPEPGRGDASLPHPGEAGQAG